MDKNRYHLKCAHLKDGLSTHITWNNTGNKTKKNPNIAVWNLLRITYHPYFRKLLFYLYINIGKIYNLANYTIINEVLPYLNVGISSTIPHHYAKKCSATMLTHDDGAFLLFTASIDNSSGYQIFCCLGQRHQTGPPLQYAVLRTYPFQIDNHKACACWCFLAGSPCPYSRWCWGESPL